MFVYRIEKEKYKDKLTGYGGVLAPGRWNHARYPIIYTSLNPSTARLETLLNWSTPSTPKKRYRLKIQIPDTVPPEKLDISALPEGWDSYPHNNQTRDLGNAWIESSRGLCLMVPCSEEPDEWNVLINPSHPDFKQVKVVEVLPISFSERLRP